jgi:hypothetical protein
VHDIDELLGEGGADRMQSMEKFSDPSSNGRVVAKLTEESRFECLRDDFKLTLFRESLPDGGNAGRRISESLS